MAKIDIDIKELHNMKKYPKELSYKGNLELLKRPKVSIVGSRRPISYTKQYTTQIVKALINRGVVIVSGGAMGVDAIAHQSATPKNSISVYATGIDIKYPSVNRNLLQSIEEEGGLVISQFKDNFKATSWSFVLRNELVVALGDILIVSEADINSGSLKSVEYAIEMGKKIFVLPHRIGESLGTNELLAKGLAKPIYDIEEFASRYGVSVNSDIVKDDFFYFCQTFPTYDEVLEKFGDRVYEAEFDEVIYIENGIVYLNG
ncbi:Rossmann fold nucleotide-binding protein Smf possibly involved in DNA uptake [hydrothermal vent metagenome]|uniref:Rossmann fold nucleotide-binding protein Smf possibly involved in DNA uptake n=1 Tax=hydrothermal vent metagenome TaxID=652676 RepID=A0A1W1ELN6_9ZZZZ